MAMPPVDLAFPVVAPATIPADHGYAVFGAVCRLLPTLHGSEAPNPLGLHPFRGLRLPGGTIALRPHESTLTVRLPAASIGSCLPLAGKALCLGGTAVRLGVPSVHALCPASRLLSRLVTIRGFLEPADFLAAAGRQLTALQIAGEARLVRRQGAVSWEGRSRLDGRCPFIRRTISIRDKVVVGYALMVDGLSEADSLRLQAEGLGGRRHFGCGVFVPTAARASSI